MRRDGVDPLTLSTLVNLRDLGGLPAGDDGATTMVGVLYRSEAPRPSDNPPGGMVAWPPRTVIDLRSAIERDTHPHPLAGDDTQVHTVPLLGDEVTAADRSRAAEILEGGLEVLYAVLLEVAAARLVKIAHLVAEAPAPILVHCAAGKDRTGLVSAMLLRCVDVPGTSVLADYAETAKNMPAVLRRLGNSPLLLETDSPKGRELTLTSVTAAEHVLRTLDGHPTGARGWLVDAGADPAALDTWHKRFVDSA